MANSVGSVCRPEAAGLAWMEGGIMSKQKKPSFDPDGLTRRLATLAGLLLTVALPPLALASEDVPHRPFAYWADLPDPGQFVFGAVYQESEAYHIWAANKYQNVTVKSGGESYGIDINQGYFALQYGITEGLGGGSKHWRHHRRVAQLRFQRECPIHHRVHGLVVRCALPGL